MLEVALYAALLLVHATDLPPGAILRLGDSCFRADGPVKHLRFSDDGRVIHGCVAGPDRAMRPTAWDVSTGARLTLRAAPEPPALPQRPPRRLLFRFRFRFRYGPTGILCLPRGTRHGPLTLKGTPIPSR